MICPCKDCPDRFVGCHGTCEKYGTWKAWKNAENETIKKAKAIDRQYQSLVHDARVRKAKYFNANYKEKEK